MSVLIVEDHSYLGEYIRAVLRQRQIPAHCVLSAEEAWRALAVADESPQLILTDLNLPGENGLEFVRRLKREPAYAAIPVVAITADDSQGRARQMREAGCAEFLVKPVLPDQLLTLVSRYLTAPPP